MIPRGLPRGDFIYKMSKRDKNPENYWFRAKRYGWQWGENKDAK